jgi:hypothetical protein
MIMLSFNSAAEESFHVSVTDYTGRVVYNNESKTGAGPNEVVYDFTGFAKGVYFIRIQTAEKSKVIRMVIQ